MRHEFSLASKLATLDVGQSIWLDDADELTTIATPTERQVTAIVGRNARLKDRKFQTARADAITANRKLHRILRVTRTA